MGQRRRILLAAALLVALSVALGAQAAVIDRDVRTAAAGEGPYVDDPTEDESIPEDRLGNTLISVHSWDDNGALVEVDPDGEIVWEWRPDNARVWGSEYVDDDVILTAVSYKVPAEDCPEEYTTHESYSNYQDHCVENVVKELDRETEEVHWEYSWYDNFIHWHEVHDVERLDDGETAIIDMGRNKVFTVNEDEEVTWEWQAEPHLDEGSEFFEEHVPDGMKGDLSKVDEYDDWTHMNDIAQLENGNFQMSIRNYDVIIEVDPETDEIVDFVGEPGNHSIMHHQHNPHRLEEHDTMLVADSEQNRIIEVDLTSDHDEIIWEYHGPPGDELQWPRDGSRLPNGNTLITDSRNNRVLEINPEGEVVWRFEDPDGDVIPLPYEADRVFVDEQPDAPPGHDLESLDHEPHPVVETVREGETLARFVLPTWMHLPQLLTLVGLVFGSLWMVGELSLLGWREWRN